MDAPQAVRPVEATEPAPIWFRRRRRNWLQRSLSALTGGFAVYGLSALLLAPPLIFLAAGLWSVIVYSQALLSLWTLFNAGQLQAFLEGVTGVDLAVRVALASGAFFALLFALIVVFSGLFGRGWRRLLLLPGLLLGVPALLAFLAGMQIATAAVTATFALPDLLATVVTIYALADAATLAALLIDLRPRRRRTRVAAQPAAQLVLVRFGPPVSPAISEAISAPTPFVVAAIKPAEVAIEPNLYDDTPSDPRMTAVVSKALDDSLPVAILPITAPQRDGETIQREATEVEVND